MASQRGNRSGLCVIYFLVFRWAITKFNIKTPGREDESDEISYSEDVTELGSSILSAIGGKDNIIEIDKLHFPVSVLILKRHLCH